MKHYVRLLRIKHYIKNLFVLAPLVFSGRMAEPSSILLSIFAFFSFCIASSIVYVGNDIVDREKDRAHPTKRNRPIASGAVTPLQGGVLVGVLVILLVILQIVSFRPIAAAMLGSYLIVNICYSMHLKNVVFLDVFLIAIGFVLRVLSGAYAIGVEPSSWILLTTFSIASFLGFGKRRNEMLTNKSHEYSRSVLKSYNRIENINTYLNAFLSTTIVFYCLYATGRETGFLTTIPVVIYGLMRYHLIIFGNESDGDPTEVIVKDRGIQVTLILYGLLVLIV